jgi:hypothetical protein
MTATTDSYRQKLHTTIAALRYWAPQLRPGAEIEDEESPSHWRLAARPHIAAACPFELVLHSEPRYDLMIAAEAYEDLAVESLDLFLPLLASISDGRVVQRTSVSRNTGQWRSIDTFVHLADGTTWQARRLNETLADQIDEDDCYYRDRHFAPYLRITAGADA